MWEGIKENFCKRLVRIEKTKDWRKNVFHCSSRMEIILIFDIVIPFINVKQQWIIQNDVPID